MSYSVNIQKEQGMHDWEFLEIFAYTILSYYTLERPNNQLIQFVESKSGNVAPLVPWQ